MGKGTLIEPISRVRTAVHTHSSAVESGDVITVGKNVLVATVDAGASEPVGYIIEGRMEFEKAAGAMNLGDAAWWNGTDGKIQTVSAGATCKAGVISFAAESGASVCEVILNFKS